MMATATIPTRFELDLAQLAGALALAGVTPAPGCGLPDAVPLKAPKRVLGDAGMLDDAGHLTPEIDAALRVAAAPERVLRILVDHPGGTATQVAQFMRTTGRDEVVSWAQTDGTFSFMILGNVDQAVILVDELLSITDLITGDGTELIDLSPAGLAALLAAADALGEDRLRAQLERVTTPAAPVLVAARLEELFQRGLTNDDSRWASAAIRLGAPIDLGALVGHLGAGLEELSSTNLVTKGQGGFVPTEHGMFVLGVLGQLVTTASLAVTFLDDGARFPVAPITLLRTATTIWAVVWTGRGAEARVSLADLSMEGALGVVSEMLDTMTRPAAPIATGAPPAAAAPPAAPAAPAAPPWVPTHRVPTGGLPTWATPDPSQPPGQRLGERLRVQVTQRQDDWVRVVCENGWAAWVDGRYLEVE
jgi:hypothetical protein